MLMELAQVVAGLLFVCIFFSLWLLFNVLFSSSSILVHCAI